MNKTLAEKLIAKELQKRQAPLPNVLGECFPEQLALINSTAKRKIACLTRRSGKSTAVGLYLINEALKNPRSKSVYVNLTKEAAKKVMWTDIFETTILKLKIPAELVGMEIRFKNGSTITLTGGDATYKEKHKLRGQKNILAVIDECQSFAQDLEEIVISVILPTLADCNGTLCMIGTPGNQMGLHYWWQLNNPENIARNKAWTTFHWSWKDNPHVKDNMQKQIEELISANPLIEETPSFRQEYLGRWVIDTDMRTYKSGAHNYVSSLPEGFLKNANYILSIDLGWEDATAFVVCAYNPNFNCSMYVLESKKYTHLVMDGFTENGVFREGVVEKIAKYRERFNFQAMVCDSSAKQLVESMRLKYKLPLWEANRPHKNAHIILLNSDFITRNVLILKDNNEELVQELETQIWDPKALLQGKHSEKAGMDNHLCDALLYGHNASRHYWFKEKVVINPNAEEEIRNTLIKQHVKVLGQHNSPFEVNYE